MQTEAEHLVQHMAERRYNLALAFTRRATELHAMTATLAQVPSDTTRRSFVGSREQVTTMTQGLRTIAEKSRSCRYLTRHGRPSRSGLPRPSVRKPITDAAEPGLS
jgi:hypothetical protein